MAIKHFCDCCGNDITSEPGDIIFTLQRGVNKIEYKICPICLGDTLENLKEWTHFNSSKARLELFGTSPTQQGILPD